MSLNTARAKGSDAAVKANLDNARAQAALFYDANTSSYMGTINTANDVCSVNATTAAGPGGVAGIYTMLSAAATASGATIGTENAVETSTTAVCDPAAGTWVAQAPLKATAGTYWCVDSTGASKQEGAVLAANSTACL